MTQEKDNLEKKLFAKEGEWFKCIQVPKTHPQYKFNKHVQYCSRSDNCICDNSGTDVYIPTYIKDFDSHFVKIIITKDSETMTQEEKQENKELLSKDLCKTCTHYWTDFPLPLDSVVSHCDILDEKKGLFACMDDEVPYPCLKCPFNCYIKKK